MGLKSKGWDIPQPPLQICPVSCTHFASKFWLIAGPGGEIFPTGNQAILAIKNGLCKLAQIEERHMCFIIVQQHDIGSWSCEVVGPANQQMRYNALGNPPSLGDVAHFLEWMQGGMEMALREARKVN